jgi:hypothetical protein
MFQHELGVRLTGVTNPTGRQTCDGRSVAACLFKRAQDTTSVRMISEKGCMSDNFMKTGQPAMHCTGLRIKNQTTSKELDQGVP